MIKIVFCLRRLPGLSAQDFSTYWRDHHAPLVRDAASALRIKRYVQSHHLDAPQVAGAVEARGSKQVPFDGIAELWWDSMDDVVAASATKEGRAAGRRLLDDEKKFIDLAASTLFYATEHVIISKGGAGLGDDAAHDRNSARP